MKDQNKKDMLPESQGEETMPDPQDKGRRSALRKLVIGAGALTAYHVLPVRWSQPIVEQIVLPAHAGTSGISIFDPCSVSIVSGNTTSVNVTVHVNGYITQPIANLPVVIVATPSGGSGGPVTVNTTTDAQGKFSANIVVTGGPGITWIQVVTTVTGAAGSGNCKVKVPEPGSKPPQGPTSTPEFPPTSTSNPFPTGTGGLP